MDARNHGESPHTDVMDYHTMSLDVAQLISDLNFDYVDVLGHSMGGKIAMTLALTNVRIYFAYLLCIYTHFSFTSTKLLTSLCEEHKRSRTGFINITLCMSACSSSFAQIHHCHLL